MIFFKPWISQTSEFKSTTEDFWKSILFYSIYLFLMHSEIICIHVANNQLQVSLKISSATSLNSEILAATPTNLLKQDFNYSSNVS